MTLIPKSIMILMTQTALFNKGVFILSKVKRAYIMFFIFIVLYFGSSFVLFFIPDLENIDLMLYNIIGQLIMFIPLLLICIAVSKDSVKNIYQFNKVPVLDIILAIFLALAIEPAMSLLSMLSTIIFPNEVSEYMAVTYDSPLIISVISTALIPAVCEEMFFRGALFSQFKNISLKSACLLTGVLFGIAHFDAQQFLYAFAMGALMCYVVYKTNSIIPTIVVHFTINFSQLIFSRFTTDTEFTEELTNTITEAAAASEMTIGQLVLPYVLMTVISIPLIYIILKFMGRRRSVSLPANNMVLTDNEFLPVYNETVFDYKPQDGFAEKIFTPAFFVILIIYIGYIALTFA